MTQPNEPIDVVYVDLKARGEEKAAHDIKAAVKKIQRDVDQAAKNVEKSFTEATSDVEHEFTKMGEELKKEAAQQEKIWKKAADDIGDAMKNGATKAAGAVAVSSESIEKDLKSVDEEIDKVKQSMRELALEFAKTRDKEIFVKLRGAKKTLLELNRIKAALDDVADEARRTETQLAVTTASSDGIFKRMFKNVGGALSSVGSLVAKGLSSLPFSLTSIVVILGAIQLLTGPIIALTAALVDLLGVIALIPAGLAVLPAIIAPAIIAFHNFGDALSAIAEGDAEKIKEALKKLAPAAAAVALEIGKILPKLRTLGKFVQQKFFEPLKGDLTRIANNLLPTFKKGLGLVAAALGKFVSDIAAKLATPKARKFFDDIFASASRIIKDLGPDLLSFFGALGRSVQAGLPFLERMADALGDGLVKFGAWIERSIKDGSFQKFIDDAFATFRDLKDLVKELGELFGALFKDTDDDGRSFLEHITAIIEKLTKFFESDKGQKYLDALMKSIPLVIALLEIMADAFILNQELVDNTGQAVYAFLDAMKELGGFLVDIYTKVTRIVLDRISVLVHAAAEAFGWIPGLGPKLKAAAARFDRFRDRVNTALAGIHDRSITVKAHLEMFGKPGTEIGGIGGSGFKGLATGGPAVAGHTYMVGEDGPEILQMGTQSGRIYPHGTLPPGLHTPQPAGTTNETFITFDDGSIQITFTGTPPTEEQARKTGVAVGQGIASALTSHDVRVGVRAL